MWNEIFSLTFLTSLLAATIRLATPILYAALGQIFTQKAGILNLGVEGTMIVSAMAAFTVSYFSGSLWLGFISAIVVGVLWSSIMAWLSNTMNAVQVIAGIGLNILGAGVASYVYRIIFGVRTLPPQIDPFPVVELPLLSKIPVIGPVLFCNNVPTYIAFLLIPVSWFLMERTTFGLRVKMVGEHPRASDAKGIHVTLIRNIAVLIGGACAGAAGAYMSTAYMNLFTDNLVQGQGFMAVAVVIFSKFRPGWALVGSLVFGFSNALQMRLQAIGAGIPNQLLLMLPYIVTIFALISTSRKAEMPSAYTKPYVRMER
ncbi:MAG TPA: ABC transporter permease [Clostridiaceae bacterium]|jgi:ABC-type uncharacterized transport system permease subunit|nr:ABC transporter permease [Clostridiaceae bacterium]